MDKKHPINFKTSSKNHIVREILSPPSLTLRVVNFFLRCTFRKKIRDNAKTLKLRRKWERFTFFLRLSPGVTCVPLPLPFCQAEWLTPKSPPIATILYLHGGGYCLGSLQTHRAFLSYLSQITNTRILSVNYRLAPEHVFPAALEDALEAYKWLLKEPNLSSIYIGGDSAGGGLAIALLLALKEQSIPLPRGAICFSPWTDLTHRGKTLEDNQNTDFLLYAPSLPAVAKLYIGDQDPAHPHLSPIYGDLRGLPPLFVQVAKEEILLSDSLRLFDKVKESKGAITLEIWQNTFHAWPYMASFLPEAREALAHIKTFLEEKEFRLKIPFL